VPQLMQLLSSSGLFLVNSKPAERKVVQVKLKIPEIADFCRQLSAMLASGITLIRAMQIIEARDAKPAVKKVYKALIDELRRGSALSESMEKQGKAFPELLINMMRAGENSGGIDTTAAKMALTYDKQHKLNSKIKSASVYPIVLVVLIIAVIIILFTVVMPMFGDLFTDMELPLPTQVMMGISHFLTTYWMYVIGGFIIAVALLITIFKQPRPKYYLDWFKLKMPVIGKLLRIIYTARFARTLASLYVSGIPMIQSLHIGRNTIGNTYIEAQFDDVINALGNGQTLSQALNIVDGFDKKLYSTVSIGEESGRLEQMLDSVSDQFDYEAEMATQRMVSLMEPAMIVIMAGVVLAVIASVLMPIFQMYQSVG
jgi:type IV pilus assembly protein PilC